MSTEPADSFYGETLPELCVDYRSTESQHRLIRSMNDGTAVPFLSISSCFNTQTDPAFCGLATLAIVLNAMQIDPQRLWKTPWRWYTEDTLGVESMDSVREVGITVEEFQRLALRNGVACELVRPEDSKESYALFRENLYHVCTGWKDRKPSVGGCEQNFSECPLAHMAISYSRETLKQTGKGHFSPIAALDLQTDSVLVFDTARFKYPPHWTPVRELFHSMIPVDEETGKSRGYFLLRQHNLQTCTCVIPT
ncbi:glutathione gamma-glutamylcysteinyltransferase 2 [Nematostella vectensis]|uniref:glutathione gamma-glutamylcysteinyltransferase 2 n=1 Tax=Nematostella vectensis TaxID=45351 RepID=UPI002077566B|nr:glutathione gamma-glutamylcysteinyltransferase 2 [Nematostella vectensis]